MKVNRREFGGFAALAAWPFPKNRAEAPGVVIAHVPAYTGRYVGSPSLAVLPGGEYLASHDLFGPLSNELNRPRTRVFVSRDRGGTWTLQAEIKGLFWAGMFTRGAELFIMGTDKNMGNVVIMRSADAGQTWTRPVDERSGLLRADGFFHTAPVPVVTHNGRIWRAMEDVEGPRMGRRFRAFMMSAEADADLLQSASWKTTNRIPGDWSWLGGRFRGWLEGNAVVTPSGNVVDILRIEEPVKGGKAAMIKISEDGGAASFDPATGFIDFLGGPVKFTIRFDSVSGLYWSIANIVPPELEPARHGRVRNTAALLCSADLMRWETRKVLLHHPDPKRHAFQYIDWLFDGPDIIAVSRTAFDDNSLGARSAHDANYLTFHRFENFRG